MAPNTILDDKWPSDLDPASVPFKRRTVTVLERAGLFDDWSRFDELTEVEVAGWWNSGPVTVEDLRTAGNAAIRRHHAEAELRRQIESDLQAVAGERWSRQVWRNDPRFTSAVPAGGTVYNIAIQGTSVERRRLWSALGDIRTAVAAQGELGLAASVAEYVEAVSGQHGKRLDALLARTGLGGQGPVTAAEAAAKLGVSHQRIGQIVAQLHYHNRRAAPPGGVWMPQLDAAIRSGWPDDYTEKAEAATKLFFDR